MTALYWFKPDYCKHIFLLVDQDICDASGAHFLHQPSPAPRPLYKNQQLTIWKTVEEETRPVTLTLLFPTHHLGNSTHTHSCTPANTHTHPLYSEINLTPPKPKPRCCSKCCCVGIEILTQHASWQETEKF